MTAIMLLWAAAGALVMAWELTQIWRDGSDLASVCRATRAEARLAGNPLMGAILGNRLAVTAIVVLIWPLTVWQRLRGGPR